jgi:type I restriction enzyme R subunit
LRISKNITLESRNQFNTILGADIADFATDLMQRLAKDWARTIKILQSESFLSLCENYQRPQRTFIEAVTAVDSVSSELLFRANDGSELKPPDYIQIFEKFVRDNPEHIQALEILLNRPRDFHTKELRELRMKLETCPTALRDKFNERNLRRAYNKELADIISIINHAAKGEELMTAETRVTKAFAVIKQRSTLLRSKRNGLSSSGIICWQTF